LEELVTIELFGRSYTFKAESEIMMAKDVADYLVEEVSKVETQQSIKSSNISKLAIMILAALNIANENMELKKKHSDFMHTISKQSSDLIRSLDAFVQ
jgi:cell division protein ZapA (FtsZ GTPase activity inhibitor)